MEGRRRKVVKFHAGHQVLDRSKERMRVTGNDAGRGIRGERPISNSTNGGYAMKGRPAGKREREEETEVEA